MFQYLLLPASFILAILVELGHILSSFWFRYHLLALFFFFDCGLNYFVSFHTMAEILLFQFLCFPSNHSSYRKFWWVLSCLFGSSVVFFPWSLLSITLTHTSLPLLGASPPETPATSIRIAAAWSLRVPRFKLSPLSSLIHTHPRTSSSPTFSPGQALKTPSYQEFRTWASTDFGNPRGSWNQSPMRRAG